MAYTKDQWEKAKGYYEAGLSLSMIKDKTGIARNTISQRAKKEQWEIRSRTISRGFIYLIRINVPNYSYYKIGIAVDVKERLKTLQTGSPFNLSLEASYYSDNTKKEESYWHSTFSGKKIKNEWFELNEEDKSIFLLKSEDSKDKYIKYLQSLLGNANIKYKGYNG